MILTMVGGMTAAPVALSTFAFRGNVETVSANRAHSDLCLSLLKHPEEENRLMAFPLLLSLYPTEMPRSRSVDAGGMNHGEIHHCLAESKNY